jgi:hypothetical protein
MPRGGAGCRCDCLPPIGHDEAPRREKGDRVKTERRGGRVNTPPRIRVHRPRNASVRTQGRGPRACSSDRSIRTSRSACRSRSTRRSVCPDRSEQRFPQQWLPWLDTVTTPSDTRAFIEAQLARFQRGKALHVTIFYRDKSAGVLGYNRIDQANAIGHLGYRLVREYNGKGIMTASVKERI